MKFPYSWRGNMILEITYTNNLKGIKTYSINSLDYTKDYTMQTLLLHCW